MINKMDFGKVCINGLILLDSDVRRDVFIGITALLVAIVVFIAGFINKQKYDVYKRVYLHSMGFIWKTLLIIGTMTFMIFCSLVPAKFISNANGSYLVRYSILQTVLNIFIIASIVITAQLFCQVSKMITNYEYNEDCINKYINKRTKKVQKSANKVKLKINKLEEYKNEHVERNFEWIFDKWIFDKLKLKYARLMDEVNNICNDLISCAREDNIEFDKNHRLANYFEYICKENIQIAKDKMVLNLQYNYRNIVGSDENLQFTRWLIDAIQITYNYKCFNEYCKFNDLVERLYFNQTKLDGITDKDVAYHFVHDFINLFLSSSKIVDVKYYEELLSTLLAIVYDYIKKDEIDAVLVLFKNINFFEPTKISNDIDGVNQANFQFACGISLCLILKYRNKKCNELEESTRGSLKKIVEIVSEKFVSVHDATIFINYFKEYYNKETKIQKKFNWFDFNSEKHKYENSYGGGRIQDYEVLKEMLCIFKIKICTSIDPNSIKKDDKYFYENLYDKLKEGSVSALEETLSPDYNPRKILKILEDFRN